MSVAYVDSSVLVGLAFGEPSAVREARRFARFRHVVTGSLTQAEVAGALRRESATLDHDPLAGVVLVAVPASLGAEVKEVLESGYVRGADCWHLAAALYIAASRDLTFITVDKVQRALAADLGFKI